MKTTPATRNPKLPPTPGDRVRPRLYTAPTCLLDLPQPLLDALRRVAPKQRLPWLTFVLPFMAGVLTYFLYGVLADAIHERMTQPPPAEPPAAEVASPPPSTDAEQSASTPPSPPSAIAGDEPRSPRAAADPNRANASTGAHRRVTR